MIRDSYEAAREAADFLSAHAAPPAVAVVLGSGLGAFAERLEDAERFGYDALPHFPSVSVVGHAGSLVVGRLPGGGPRVAALAGRVHLYEGHPTATVVHPVRTLRCWGVRGVVITNAAGGINAAFMPGDLMLINDHLNLSGDNPLVGHNDERLGTRFPDMSRAYDTAMGAHLLEAAAELGVLLRQGVYAGLRGPSYETPAEIRMLRTLGADAVGMSTVLEVVAAHHAGLRVAGISCITNLAAGMQHSLDHAEVAATARSVRDAFVGLLDAGLRRIARDLEAA